MRREQRLSAPLRRAFAVLALFFLGVTAVCLLGVVLLGGLPGDAESAAEVREGRASGWLALAPAHALDWLGRPVPAAVVVALVAGWVRRIGWRYTLLVIGAAGVTGVTWLIRDLVDRGRPIGAAIEDPSFPSGHTAWAAAVFGVLAVLALQRRRWLGVIACVVLAGAIGPRESSSESMAKRRDRGLCDRSGLADRAPAHRPALGRREDLANR